MRKSRCHRQGLFAIGVLMLGPLTGFCANSSADLTAEQIVQKVVARAHGVGTTNQRLHYVYTKLAVTEDFDGKGRVKDRKEKLFYFENGRGLLTASKINGRRLSADELQKQENLAIAQRGQITQNRSTRRDDNWDKFLTTDVLARYHFTLLDRVIVNGRAAYVVSFRPAATNLAVGQINDRLLNQLTGKVWIDVEEFEIARAEISLLSKVTLGGGLMELLGSLRRFDFTIERVRLEDGVWFSRATTGDFEGRKLMDSTRVRITTEAGNFRKLSAGEELAGRTSRR